MNQFILPYSLGSSPFLPYNIQPWLEELQSYRLKELKLAESTGGFDYSGDIVVVGVGVHLLRGGWYGSKLLVLARCVCWRVASTISFEVPHQPRMNGCNT